MKLLLDQGLPRTAAKLPREASIDAVHVAEIGAATATDSAILQIARDQTRTVVTLDADFHALLALSSEYSPSVIRIRIEGLRGDALVSLLMSLLPQCNEDIQLGALVTIQEMRVRVKRLPLI